MSTILEDMAARSARDTGSSLRNERERPAGVITLRRMYSSPDFSWNSASTTQLRVLSLKTEASALLPRIRESAPSRMDFPAPVSPVIIIRPSGKVISREDIRA